jgi:superfamily I DNA and/or RNA helicase
MSLLPLVKGCKKLVMIGDPKLPPPIVMNPLARSKGMNVSLF